MNDPKLDAIVSRLDALTAQVAYLVERQRKQEELFAEMTPILKEVMATATTRLDALEKKGYFAFGKELVQVGDRVVTGFSPDGRSATILRCYRCHELDIRLRW